MALALALATVPTGAGAWIYPEHRDIATEAIAQLSPADRAGLEALWKEARTVLPPTTCEPLSAGDQGLKPTCIDFAAFPALSGDHSCSPKEVLEKVLPSKWILDVARVSAETKAALASSGTRDERLNAVATNNLKLQVVDPEYATRAGVNTPHFLLPRTGDDLRAYVKSCITEGVPLNALGLYAQYHIAALGLAQRLASGAIPPAERAAAARDVLALEGYSLHWLEDIYSSGHDVGTWGNDAWRKGTHDYYSEFGIDTVDWRGRTVVAYGDAHMTLADLKRGATGVAVESAAAGWRPAAGRRTGAARAVLGSRAGCHPRLGFLQGHGPAGARRHESNGAPFRRPARADASPGHGAGRSPPAALPRRARAIRRCLMAPCPGV